MAVELRSKPLIDQEIENLKKRSAALQSQGIRPKLAIVLVGSDEPSQIYTRNKKKFCEKIDADCDIIHLGEDTSEDKFIEILKSLAEDDSIHGYMVQEPRPKQLQSLEITDYIDPKKDADGFHPRNIFRLFRGDGINSYFCPCTPWGVTKILDHYNIDCSGKNTVVIGRSMIVGKPMAALMTNLNSTVTLCHSRTQNLKDFTAKADIVISAVGNPEFLKAENFKENAVVIDVGITRNKEGKLCGDVDFEDVKGKVQAITPVPGGVGPMTIFCLAENLIKAAELSIGKK